MICAGSTRPRLFAKKSSLKEKDDMVGDGFWLCPSSALITGSILLKLSDAMPKTQCCEEQQSLALNL